MTTPSSPNYITNVGRLVTDRFDFQKHVDGYSFNHNASSIDLDADMVIDSVTVGDVQGALTQLAAVVGSTTADATTTVKGLVKLAGDIGGTADSVSVLKIRGRTVANTTPSHGQILTWNSLSSTWGPETPSNTFTAGGDLSGTNLIQSVVGITGSSGTVIVEADEFVFSEDSSPSFNQIDAASGNGTSFSIVAQSPATTDKNGGHVFISGGTGTGTGLNGGVILQMANSSSTMLELREVVDGQRVMSLFKGDGLTSVEMPEFTGDMVLYVANAITPPDSGVPVGGAILYAEDGYLCVKQSNGTQFKIGEVINPTMWNRGTSDYHIVYRNDAMTTTDSASNILSYPIEDLSIIKADVVIIGKEERSTDSACYNLQMAYCRSGGAPSAIGTVTLTDTRTSGGASGWTVPDITVSGNNLLIKTGYNAATTIVWFASVTLHIVKTSA